MGEHVVIVVVGVLATKTVVVTVVAVLVAVGQMVDIITAFTSGHDDEIGVTIKETHIKYNLHKRLKMLVILYASQGW